MKKLIKLFLLFFIIAITTIVFIILSSYIKNEKIDTSYIWNINFANLKITEGSKKGNITLDNNNINIDITLKQNEYLEFVVDISNSGSIDAIVKQINLNSEKNGESLQYYLSYLDGKDIKSGDELKSNETKTIKVRIEYSNIDSDNTMKELKLSLSIDLESKVI